MVQFSLQILGYIWMQINTLEQLFLETCFKIVDVQDNKLNAYYMPDIDTHTMILGGDLRPIPVID